MMPAKVKEREKDRDRDPDSSKIREKHRHKSSRSSHKAKKASTQPEQGTTGSSPTSRRRASVPESKSDRVAPSDSPMASKTSLPYPSFSKAHSKEAVGSRDNVHNPRLSYYTPDPTDLEQDKKQNAPEEHRKSVNIAPPSPPETTVEEKVRIEEPKETTVRVERKRTDLQKAADELKRKLTGRSASSEVKDRRSATARSKNSRRDSVKEAGKSAPLSARSSKPSTPSK